MYNYQDYLEKDYFKNTTPDVLRNNQPHLYTPEEGYNKGNLFTNLYERYKNYEPVSLSANTEQGKLYLELSRYAFAAHELNLYLDLHPEDTTMLALFNDYRKKANELIMKYEDSYGPLTVSSDTMSNSFLWEEDSFPWEGGNV